MRRVLLAALCLAPGLGGAQQVPPCPAFVAAESRSGIQDGGKVSLSVSLKGNPTAPVPLPAAALRFAQGEGFGVDPGEVRLAPGERATVHVTVHGENPGLVRLQGAPIDGTPACVGLDVPVDVGFDGAVRLQVDSPNAELFRTADESKPNGSIDTKEPHPLFLRLVTHVDAKPVRYDPPVTARIATSDALLSSDGTTWERSVVTPLGRGWSPQIYLKPTRWSGGGTLRVDLKADSSDTSSLRTESIRFVANPPLALRLLLAAAGGLAYTLVTRVADDRNRGRRTRGKAWVGPVVSGVFVGLVAAALAENGWLPVALGRADTWGYALAGVLAASLGIDGVLKRLQAVFKWPGAAG